MGQAKARGSYETRKANPQGRVLSNDTPNRFILAFIERGFQHVPNADTGDRLVPVVRRHKPGDYISIDGKSRYHFDGKQLRRQATPTP